MSNAKEEVINHLIKARELVLLACSYDDNNNTIQAIQYYDQSIIFIDDVLSKLPQTCSAYELLKIYREKYNIRLVILSILFFFCFLLFFFSSSSFLLFISIIFFLFTSTSLHFTILSLLFLI